MGYIMSSGVGETCHTLPTNYTVATVWDVKTSIAGPSLTVLTPPTLTTYTVTSSVANYGSLHSPTSNCVNYGLVLTVPVLQDILFNPSGGPANYILPEFGTSPSCQIVYKTYSLFLGSSGPLPDFVNFDIETRTLTLSPIGIGQKD